MIIMNEIMIMKWIIINEIINVINVIMKIIIILIIIND